MALRAHTKVFTVFSFLKLKSADIFWYQWIYPTAIAAVLFIGFRWFGSHSLTYEAEKLVADINSLMGILVGFYIAALAAVSSFTNENLDQVMKGRSPTLISTRQGKEIKETLTRRRFLAVLFGYCATPLFYIFLVCYIFISRSADLTCLGFKRLSKLLKLVLGLPIYGWFVACWSSLSWGSTI